jgi:hypothetical protein
MWKLKKATLAVIHRSVANANVTAATTTANARRCKE